MQWNATGSVQSTASRPDQRWMRFTCGRGDRNEALQLPEDARAGRDLHDREHDSRGSEPRLERDRRGEDRRDDVGVGRADAGEEVTAVDARLKRYDRRVSRPEPGWPLRRIVVVPLVLFVVVSANGVHARQAPPREAPRRRAAPAKLGDAVRGQVDLQADVRRLPRARTPRAASALRLAGAQITRRRSEDADRQRRRDHAGRARQRRARGRRPRLPREHLREVAGAR